MALRDLGLKEADLDRAADLATSNPYWNPRPLEAEGIRVSIAGRMMANEPIWLRDFFATSTLWYWGFVLGLTLLVLLTGWRRKPAPAPAPDRN